MRNFKPWTPEEDRILRKAVIQACSQSLPINWMEVALHFVDRDNKDCRKRWVYSLSPSIKKGPWDLSEDAALREGVQLHGTKWSHVSRHVRTRQADQCSRRWHEISKPNINRGRWSLYDEKMLKNAVRAHGRHWIEIVERYFPDRTPVATKNKYNQLLRREGIVLMSDI